MAPSRTSPRSRTPFTQRLQGKKTTFDQGAGIAFHPNADGIATPQNNRLAFVASANGSIEMVDIAYYDFQRGTLATKFNLYGPLRASLPFPGDDPSVVFKLFGVSSDGTRRDRRDRGGHPSRTMTSR